jgi:hypothetical protein
MIPDGELLRSRVVTALAPALSDVLDRRLDGYALLSSRDALLGGDEERGVITFEAGVPVLAYHSRTDRGGPPALDDIGAPPYRFELYALEADALELPHRTDELRVAPGSVAERLAGDPALAGRTRELAGDVLEERSEDTVEAFLEDEAAIADIRRSAREEALDRADEWDFADAVGE